MQTDVKRYAAVVPISQEMLIDRLPPFEELMAAGARADAAFRALPSEEQARILAEREAAHEAKRCTACGCHPDEHGDC